MANKSPQLTISNLVKAFKEAGFATKNDLKDALEDYPTKENVGDIVHNQLTEFHANMTQPELNKINSKIDNLTVVVKDHRDNIAEIKRDIHYVKDDINNIEFEMGIKHNRKAIPSLI